MQIQGTAKLLRIFVGESDRVHHTPLHEAIVREARAAGMAGATAWRGMLSFGPTSRIRTSKVLDLSSDLPVIVEVVDTEEKIDAFVPRLTELFEQADSGGLVTMERVEVIQYT
ncbi:MAG: DUF190 domain-containing protein, partial [Chitinivibrionales bacterium]|nr:DUF190 domain-containing protein [Chitinivibrionales bacterium]